MPTELPTHDFIHVIGAQENNLKNLEVQIPKRKLTVFTGVSGSGKSSLVFDTIATESQRLINETYPAFIQGFMGNLNRPHVDDLRGLTPAIVVSQEKLGANARSTVGTVTDVSTLLRLIWAKFGVVAENNTKVRALKMSSPNAFSFNVPNVKASGAIKVEKGKDTKTEKRTYEVNGGMCADCEGLGVVNDIDLTKVFNVELSLNDGAITVPGYTADGWAVRLYSASGFFPADQPIKTFTAEQLQTFLYGEPVKVKIESINMTYEGLIPKLQKSMFSKDIEGLQPHIRKFVETAVTFAPCPACEGTRLNPAARAVTVAGLNIAQAHVLEITDLLAWVQQLLAGEIALAAAEAPLISEGGLLLTNLAEQLSSFVEIGLGYLSLARSASSLSGGEAQRVKMIRHLRSALTDMTYVFDEPTAGLHPHDIERMKRVLLQLRDAGNTVLVIEHRPEVIEIADHIIDMGPGAGKHGGEIMFAGTFSELLAVSDAKTSLGTSLPNGNPRKADSAQTSVTSQVLSLPLQVKTSARTFSEKIELRGVTANNLRGIDVDVPLGVLTAVTGVAGSGKSTLIGALVSSGAAPSEIIMVDQGAIKGSRRSNPATYTGVFDPIRKAFAKASGQKPALFSANSEGACETCKGAGVIYTDLGFMQTVENHCESCDGRRFDESVLQYHLEGKSIADVLEMPAQEALEFFTKEAKNPAVSKVLQRLVDVGLEYLSLGQSLTTLSGGERQRLKLASQMADKGGIYVLDEPSTGLHLADTRKLLALLDQLVDSGKTVIVVEHNLHVVAHADWVIDLGPGAGHEGGQVVYAGTVSQMHADKNLADQSKTAQYIQKY
ncbi:putative excinuclease ABC, A subunit [Gleimia coleocanis DSM 15436]|uniref:UvrABC system protein A n=1 Tax=Gleimia coleocanis DSM 15436 TaxID=525245 RepID=C0VYB5_9ACTO|nr:excinuclease ABC subunit UvrA [Gleimia coleocanis]EEH64418.1 putative excinuclease ABC, A subunit [Gleimia coleocanis DSM 15436]